jgi:hypothetical protein
MSSGKQQVGFAVASLLMIISEGACGSAANGSPSPSLINREAEAQTLVAGIRVSVTVKDAALAVMSALADFGIEGGTRQVDVRVVKELQLELRIDTERLVVLEDEPIVCLRGPFYRAPVSTVSDPCWGEPDLTAVLKGELLGNSDGRPVLSNRQAVTVEVSLARTDARCDYAPGGWHLELAANPRIDGAAAGAREIANVVFDIPLDTVGPLERLPSEQTSICSSPASVFTSQGDPPV